LKWGMSARSCLRICPIGVELDLVISKKKEPTMRRYFLLVLVVCLASSLSLFACGGGDNPEEYEGDEPGECSDEADNDRDGQFDCDDSGCANSPACSCTDQCTPEGLTECDGDVVKTCTLGTNGCLDFTEEDCTDSEKTCVEGECVIGAGFCSATGDPCAVNGDCPTTEVTGFCIVRDDAAGNWVCGYDTRFDTGSTVTCEGQTVGHCEFVGDCPGDPDMYCGYFGESWCGATSDGICTISKGPDECVDDSECSFTPENTCVTCGDGVKHDPLEECDDGGTVDGDGCSAECRFEGVCRQNNMYMGCGCATADDCIGCGMCSGTSCGCYPS
jgi:hypothetical protein